MEASTHHSSFPHTLQSEQAINPSWQILSEKEKKKKQKKNKSQIVHLMFQFIWELPEGLDTVPLVLEYRQILAYSRYPDFANNKHNSFD